VPVTPGVHFSGQSAYFDHKRPPTSASDKVPFDPQGSTPGPRWNANNYELPAEDKSGAELIDSFANAMPTNDEVTQDPTRQHPDLHLSGHVISASFNVPYSIGFCPGNDWVRYIFRTTIRIRF
jgi:trehalose 6-phosphate synthase/phosphatase